MDPMVEARKNMHERDEKIKSEKKIQSKESEKFLFRVLQEQMMPIKAAHPTFSMPRIIPTLKIQPLTFFEELYGQT